jgi:hypothetical protein
MFIFCVTNSELKYLEQLPVKLVGVGKNIFSKKYISCLKGKNIQKKEKNYSELTFHYWFWKNRLKFYNPNSWIGFCQKRRFWTKSSKKIMSLTDLKKNIITKAPKQWSKYESVICKPIRVDQTKKMKLIKRGLKNLIKNPSIFFNEKKRSIKLHFDMHHGYGILENSIRFLKVNDREDFREYINNNREFNPHIMCISKKQILNKWFIDLFGWLFKCEKFFGLSNLKGYDQERLYAYLAERYLSFWFKKYTKYLEWHWSFYDGKE